MTIRSDPRAGGLEIGPRSPQLVSSLQWIRAAWFGVANGVEANVCNGDRSACPSHAPEGARMSTNGGVGIVGVIVIVVIVLLVLGVVRI
jgi:hypothetical protein